MYEHDLPNFVLQHFWRTEGGGLIMSSFIELSAILFPTRLRGLYFTAAGRSATRTDLKQIRTRRCVGVSLGKLPNHVGPEIGDNQILESH